MSIVSLGTWPFQDGVEQSVCARCFRALNTTAKAGRVRYKGRYNVPIDTYSYAEPARGAEGIRGDALPFTVRNDTTAKHYKYRVLASAIERTKRISVGTRLQR